MQDTIDIFELLTSQHDEVDALLEQLEGGSGNRAQLFTQLADKLAAHATVEEKIFYPAAMADRTSDQLHEAVEEHLAIKRLIADMMALDPQRDAEVFDAKLSVLTENVSHHARQEEEGKLFPILRRAFSAEQIAALGNEVLAMFEQLVASGHPSRNVPGETDHAARLPHA